MLVLQIAATSVAELETATLLALTRKPDPAEDFPTAVDRIADNIAASHQEECLVQHHSSIASDAKIARSLQENEKTKPSKKSSWTSVWGGNSMEFGHMTPLCKYVNPHVLCYRVGTKIRAPEHDIAVLWKARIIAVELSNGRKSV